MNASIRTDATLSTPTDARLTAELTRLRLENRRFRNLLRRRVRHGSKLSAPSAIATRTEPSRAEGEERLRLALNAAQLGTWDWDMVTGEFNWSARCKEIYGISDEMELNYSRFLALLHPDDRARTDAAAIAAAFDGTTYDIEYRCVWPDGSIHWITATGHAIYRSDGRPYRAIGVVRDITLRKETEEALRASETVARARAEELETVMETAPAGIFFANDPQCHHVTANRAGYQMMRVKPGSSLSKTPPPGETPSPFTLLRNGREIANEELPLQLAAQTGETVSGELEIVFADGLVRHVYGTAAPLRDLERKVRGSIAIFFDTTEQKLAERDLARSRRLFERIAATTPDILYVYDVVSKVCVYANARLTEVLGYSTAEIGDARSWIHAEGGDEMAGNDTRIANLSDGEVIEREYRVRHANGSDRWMRTRTVAFLRESDDTVRQVLGLAHDITEARAAQQALRASEELYRVLTEVSPQIVWTADAEGILDYCNQHWCEFSGMTFGESVRRGWVAAIHPNRREQARLAWERYTREGRGSEIEVQLRRHDGVYRWHLGRTVAVKDGNGRVVRWVGIALDIEERKQAEEALLERERELRTALASAEEAREAAEAAGRAKDQFLAVLSHELRTPLTPVLMAVSALLAQKALPEPICEAMQMIRRNIQLESRLIDDLLDLTRIARGKMEFALQPMDLHEAIHCALEICAAEIEEKSHHLSIELRALSHVVHGDFSRLQQVFWNLIKNATKFTPRTGTLTIRSENVGDLIRIEIADSGIGIESDVLLAIFNPFEQGSQRIVREFGGLGLGLAISRATIEGHRGCIFATSAGKNHGAVFTVELSTLP